MITRKTLGGFGGFQSHFHKMHKLFPKVGILAKPIGLLCENIVSSTSTITLLYFCCCVLIHNNSLLSNKLFCVTDFVSDYIVVSAVREDRQVLFSGDLLHFESS